MICPQCGSKQPIAENCEKCGAGLLEASSIRVTEYIPPTQGVRLFFLTSLLIFAIGIFLIYYDIYHLSLKTPAVPPALSNHAVLSNTSPEKNDITAQPSQGSSVLVFTQIGSYDPRILRTFENEFQGQVSEFPIDRPEIAKKMFDTNPDFLVVFDRIGQKQIAANPRISKKPQIVITDKITERSLQSSYAARRWLINSRPTPQKVFRAITAIVRRTRKKVAILHDPLVDEVYSTDLYGQALDNNYAADLVEWTTVDELSKYLTKIKKDQTILMVLESPQLQSPAVIEIIHRYWLRTGNALVSIGSLSSKAGAIMEFATIPEALGNVLHEVILDVKTNGPPDPPKTWYVSEGIHINFFGKNAKRSRQIQAKRFAKGFQKNHPDYRFDFLP